MRCNQRDHSISKGSKAVHPIGSPISHSTNRGFKTSRESPAGAWRERLPPCVEVMSGASPLPSWACGVAQRGQDKDSASKVWGSDSCGAEKVPFRIEPRVGQAPENVSKPGNKQAWDVFQEDDGGSHFANDAHDFWEDPAVVFRSPLRACEREGLAGEPRRDAIHEAAPRAAVEGCKVVPDRSPIQGRVFHPRHEEGRSEGFPLNESHSAVIFSEGEPESELQSSDPGT